MSTHRPEHLDLCAAWVLGCLDEADRFEFEAHRGAGCAECEREIARLQEAAGLLAASAPPAAPPASLRERTLRAARATAQDPPAAAGAARPAGAPAPAPVVLRPRRFAMPTLAWAAAAAVLAVSAAGLWWSGDLARRDLAAARAELDETRRALAATETSLEDAKRWNAVLDAPQSQMVELAATPAGVALMRARALWDPATRRAVIVFDNASAPAGHDFQLWGIHPDGPASLGLIRADDAGRAVVRLEDVGDPSTLQAIAVSLEPEGGSPNPSAPTGPVVMVGKVTD